MISIAFFACEKEMSLGVPAKETGADAPDLTTRISSSVSGFVTDENNAAAAGASVSFGASTAVTDSYGYFEIRNVQVVKNAAVVTVTKSGYFPGIKTYAATTGRKAFFRIKLIPKVSSGSFNSSTGGAVTLPSGLGVSLPAGAVVNAATGASYTGVVNVASFWINPAAADLTQIMPGDLRGLDNAGSMKGLTTYGMAAVELRTPAGEKLQVAPGRKATITMPMTGSVLANAPASIPLWYFDESNGLWKQEGSATKTGSAYVGDVSHFSYWNCDLPNAIVPLTFTVVNSLGNPLANVHVEITPTTPNSWSHIGGYTDSTGFVSVFVTPNASYNLSLISNGCNNASYTQSFSVGTTAVDLGTLTLGASITYTLTGTATDCSNVPVSNGYVVLQNGGFERHSISATGTFSFTALMCNSGNTATIAAVNAAANQQSPSLTVTPVAGVNAIGNLQACTLSSSEFINYSIDGVSYSVSGASATYTYSGNSDSTHVVGWAGNHYVDLAFKHTGIAANSMQVIESFFSTNLPTGMYTAPATISNIHITEYGNINEFVAGNFTATVFTTFATPVVSSTVACSFRVRRSY